MKLKLRESVRFNALEGITFTEDEDIIFYFVEGQCNALAWEIHKLTGFSLGIYTDSPLGSDYSAHAYAYTSDGLILDIRGIQTFDKFKLDWPWLHLTHRFSSSKEFEKEMTTWNNVTHYTKDRRAKEWAKRIVAQLHDDS